MTFRSAMEPEPEYLAESRARGPIPPKRPDTLTPEQLDAISSSFEQIEKYNESPIEHSFGIAAAIELGRLGLRLIPQYQLPPYRFDFAVMHPKVDQVLALVECDGAQFHSTPEQIANDRRKDAAAEQAGAIIIRFSGSAIYREPRRCANDLVGSIRRAWRIR